MIGKAQRAARKGQASQPVSVVTGGAGFLGSHLVDYLLGRGHRVVAVDNLVTGSVDNIAHLAGKRDFKFIEQDVTEFLFLDTGGGLRLAFRLARQPGGLSGVADSDVEGRDRWGRTRRWGWRCTKSARFLAGFDFGSVWRSAGASADGELLGQCQSHRAAGMLRRIQAVCGGADDGVSPGARSGDAHRAHFQHLRPAHAIAGRAGGAGVHQPGVEEPSR